MAAQQTSLDNMVRAYQCANRLLSEFGLKEAGWTFELSNRKTSLGTCFYKQKKIVFSKHFLDSPWETIEDTIRHEIAHALIDPKNGHNALWRRTARLVGAEPTTCAEQDSYVKTASYNYELRCPNPTCGRTWQRHRLKFKSHPICHCGAKLDIYKLV